MDMGRPSHATIYVGSRIAGEQIEELKQIIVTTTYVRSPMLNSFSFAGHDHQNYDYNNQKPEDYTDDYSQDLNDYYDQNLLAPPNPRPPPILPPPTSLQPPLGKITFFLLQIR